MRARLDKGFVHLATLLYDFPYHVLPILFIIVGLMLSQLPTLYFDSSIESFLSDDDSSIVNYKNFRRTFGRDTVVVVVIEESNVFRTDFLQQLFELHRQFEQELPYIDEVKSLINARLIEGKGDELLVQDLLEDIPQTEKELSLLAERVRSNIAYRDTYISEDESFVSLVIRLHDFYRDPVTGEFNKLEDVQIKEIAKATESVVSQWRGKFDNIYVSGSPIIIAQLDNAIQRDMRIFILCTLLIISAFLLLLFRRWSGVFVPLITVVLSAALTLSCMALFDQPLQPSTSLLPSFILAVGVGDSVHFLTHFYRSFASENDKRKAMMSAFRYTAVPMFFTSITTAAGLLSFSRADIMPVANIGVFAAIGMLIAFILTMTLTPIILRLLPITSARSDNELLGLSFVDRSLQTIGHLAIAYPKCVVIGGITLMTVALISASNIRFAHNPLYWFPEDSELRVATKMIDDNMGGTIPVEVVIRTKQVGGAKEPVILSRIEESQEALYRLNSEAESAADTVNSTLDIGKVISLTDIVKETNRALHANHDHAYRIPETKEMLATAFFLLEISDSDELLRMVDRQYQQIRNTIMLPWDDAIEHAGYESMIKSIYETRLVGLADVTITGLVPVLTSTLDNLMTTTAVSYIVAMLVISFMMVVLMASVKYGLLSLLPNIFPIVLILGFMPTIDAPLDMFTMLIGSIAIGLAVDDTVHFMHTFRRLYDSGLSTSAAVSETIATTGKAMLITTIVLSLGFFVYMLSTLNNMYNFGLLTGLCIILALLADFFLAPALLILLHKGR